MKNFKKVSVKEEARTELHDVLGLTGAEISVNILPSGGNVPFVHSHKHNEEIYAILEGKGYAIIDDERVDLSVGDFICVKPEGKRQFFADKSEGMKYICIQVRENSLEGYTMTDAVI